LAYPPVSTYKTRNTKDDTESSSPLSAVSVNSGIFGGAIALAPVAAADAKWLLLRGDSVVAEAAVGATFILSLAEFSIVALAGAKVLSAG
jgi:hypothetical protein